MASSIDGIKFPTGPDLWAYAQQQEELARSIASRFMISEATAAANDEQVKKYVDTLASSFGGRSAYDVAVANGFVGSEAQWLASLRGPKGDPGVSDGSGATDAALASFVSAGTATKAALDKVYRRGYSVKEYGAVGDGVADDTAAIQAAADAAVSAGADATLYFPEGRYKTTNTIRVLCAVDGRNGQIEYYGTGTALLLGREDVVSVISRKNIYLPRIINRTNTLAKSFDGASIGARLINISTCQIAFDFIQNFEYGLVCEGMGQGFVHNNVSLGALWNNHTNLMLKPVAFNGVNGWVNSNLFLGGRLSADAAPWGFADDPNASYINMVAPPNGIGPNANTFIGTSIEGKNLQQYRVQVTGSYNHFYNCRWEHPVGDIVRVRWGAKAYNNRIVGGYDFGKVIEEWDVDSGSNTAVIDGTATEGRSFNIVAQAVPSGQATPMKWTAFNGFKTQYSDDGTITPRPGRWQIDSAVLVQPSLAAGYIDIKLVTGTGTVFAVSRYSPTTTAIPITLRVSGRRNFKPGESFSVVVQHNSGANLSVSGSAYFSQVQLDMIA